MPAIMHSLATIAEVHTELLRYRLDRPVGGSGVAMVDVITAQITLDNGIYGFGFSYAIGGGGEPALAACRGLATARLAGQPFVHPEVSWHAMVATLNRTRRGPNMIGLAALDVALWDLHARRIGVSIGQAMGGAPRAVRVYGSGEFGPATAPEEAAEIALRHVTRGLRGVKPRVGGRAEDAHLIRAVTAAVPRGVDVMVDANEKCTAAAAHRLCAMAREAGVLFVEEPLAADDHAGYAALGSAFPGLLATGEHLQGASEMATLMADRSVGVLQPDLAMVGGLTEVLRIARVAAVFGIEVAPHFLPGLFVHVASAAPSITWLEEFPLLEPLFTGWPELASDGTLAPRPSLGHGLALLSGARDVFRIDI